MSLCLCCTEDQDAIVVTQNVEPLQAATFNMGLLHSAARRASQSIRDAAVKAGSLIRESVEEKTGDDDEESEASASPSSMGGFCEVHAEEDPRGPSHRGLLMKKSKGLFGRGATWTQRMFLLEEHVLTYHAVTPGGPLGAEPLAEDLPDVDTTLAASERRRLQVVRGTEAMEVPQASGPTQWRFRVWQSKNEYWDLCAPTEADRAIWIAKVVEAKRPVWQDQSVPGCKICRSMFGPLVWRHHCRSCGSACCEACTPADWHRPLPELGYIAPVRVCRNCFTEPPGRTASTSAYAGTHGGLIEGA